MPDNSAPKLRVMRVCPAPGYLPKFRKHFELKGKLYAEQVKFLQAEGVYLPGGWAGYMEKLGFEVFDVLHGDFQLAAQWAEENNRLFVFKNTNPIIEILQHQIIKFQPDIIMFWTGAFYQIDRKHRNELRNFKNGVIITGLWGDELPHGESYANYFGDVDFMFVVNNTYRKAFEESGIRAYTMGSGFDESIRYNAGQKTKTFNVMTCGDTGYEKLDHIHRYELLCKVAASTDIKIFANEPPGARPIRRKLINFALNTLSSMPYKFLRGIDILLSRFRLTRGLAVAKAIKFSVLIHRAGVSAAGFFPPTNHPRGNFFNGKKSLKKLFPNKVTKGPLESSKYCELIAKSRIVLNIHRDEEADSGNLRVFETTGIGSVLLTDRGESLKEFFKVDYGSDDALEIAEIATFSTDEECLEKIDYLLKNPDVADRIAANGQRRTLNEHTVKKRCELIAPILHKEYCGAKNKSGAKPTYVSATYDTQYYPIGWDIAFFVEAAEITRQLINGQGTIVNILYPLDMARLPGVPLAYDQAVDLHSREFRLAHICSQIANLFPNVTVNIVKDHRALIQSIDPECNLLNFPGEERPHHTEYYRIVNANPTLVNGFTASPQALRYIKMWLSTFTTSAKRLICISIRDYPFDTQRNSKLGEWVKFIDSLDKDKYEVIIVPDTDQIGAYETSPLGPYRAFWPACFDVDLRFALYELAFLNLGVNNGPMTASSLNKKVRYLMFKLVVPGVPHCTEEFISWSGYPVGSSPVYGSDLQKWVWEDDDFPVILREFNAMVSQIQQAPHTDEVI